MIVHAAGETGPARNGTIAILLAAADEAELMALSRLDKHSYVIVEGDGPYTGQALAVGFPPCPERKRCYGHLRLWRGGNTVTRC